MTLGRRIRSTRDADDLRRVDGALIKRDGAPSVTPATVWLDLLSPNKDEEHLVEQALGISVPTREEMAEIEASSRVYQEAGVHVMTAIVLHQSEGLETLIATPVTFILAGNQLVTVRYAEPRAFKIFLGRAQKKDAPCISGAAILTGLLEAIIDREGRSRRAYPGRGRQAFADDLRRARAESVRARAGSM
jgi:magnesium transporter